MAEDPGKEARPLAESKSWGGEKPPEVPSASDRQAHDHRLTLFQGELDFNNAALQKDLSDLNETLSGYKNLWENSPLVYLTVNWAGRIMTINNAGIRLFEKSRHVLVNERLSTLVGTEYQVPVQLMIERAFEVGFSENQEIKITGPDGSDKICRVTSSLVELEAEQDELHLIVTDITEQKQREDAQAQAGKMSEALNHINLKLHTSLDVDEVMERLMSEGVSVLGSQTAAITLRRGGRWIVKQTYGMPANLIGARMNDEQERHALLAIQSKQPIAISDAFNDQRVNHSHMRKYNIRAVLVVPLIGHGKPIGALFFNYHDGPHRFSEAEASFAFQLGTTAVIARENAHLYTKSINAKKGLQKIQGRLEARVRKRTAELESKALALHEMNSRLMEEVEKRKLYEKDLKISGEKIAHENRRRRLLSQKLVALLEQDRQEISQALHDDIGQMLTAISARLEMWSCWNFT